MNEPNIALLLASSTPLTHATRQHISNILNNHDYLVPLKQQLVYLGIVEPNFALSVQNLLCDIVLSVPNIIDIAHRASQQENIEALILPLLQQSSEYYLIEDDLIPDHKGLLGLLDDSYLAMTVLDVASADYQALTGFPLFDKNNINEREVIRKIIGSELTNRLDNMALQTYESTAVFVEQQQLLVAWDQTLNIANTYHAESDSRGVFWEDEMAQMSAELGLDLNF